MANWNITRNWNNLGKAHTQLFIKASASKFSLSKDSVLLLSMNHNRSKSTKLEVVWKKDDLLENARCLGATY